MCRSIKTLRNSEESVTDEEVSAAALQYVRKISGYRRPSKANQLSFDLAVERIAQSSRDLLDSLVAPRSV